MAIKINFDILNQAQEPTFILADRKGNKIGLLAAREIALKDTLSDSSEIVFKIYKSIDGKECDIWNNIKDFKLVWCKEWDTWFDIKVELQEIDKQVVKVVTCYKLGVSELSQIMLYGIEINTETDISRDDYTSPTVFYNPENKDCSLLDRLISEKAPHYTIIHVDESLKDIQKTFSFDDKSIYDAFQEISEEVECLFVFNSNSDINGNIARTISVYDLNNYCNNCGHRGSFIDVCSECGNTDVKNGYGEDTTIFITSDTLAEDIELATDIDSVKNCFKIEGGDDLINASIRNYNPNGTDYIWHISNNTLEDMSDELANKIKEYNLRYSDYQDNYKININESMLNDYNELIDKYSEKYQEYLNMNSISSVDVNTLKVMTPIIGYSNLMISYYNTIDFNLFLQSVLLPSFEIIGTTAEEEATKISKNLSMVAVNNLSNSTSKSIVDNAVSSLASCFTYSTYKVEIQNSTYSYDEDNNDGVWDGTLIITNSSDDTDTTTLDKSLTIGDELSSYLEQKIIKKLKNSEEDKYSITGLFDLSLEDFEEELSYYNLDSLNMICNSCQAVLNLLIEQGVSDKEHELYDNLYNSYYKKLKAIEDEIELREDEIFIIADEYNGLQNYILNERNNIQSALNFEKYLGEENWLEFCSYRREDKYSNTNYISDGLNNAELFDKVKELFKVANDEIKKSSELQISIKSTLRNLLFMKEFLPLINNFEVGNWIRIKIDNDIYKLRLIEYEIDYEVPDSLYVVFSDVIKTKDSISDIKSILNKSSSMATSYDSVKHQASQGSNSNKKLNDWVNRGLSLTNMQILSDVDNQEITWDSEGFLMREYDPVTESYSDKQLKIINKGLYITNDNWETSKAGIGNFIYYDPTNLDENGNMLPVETYGVIADTLVGNLILGEEVGIYTTGNDIVLNKNGLMITNGVNTVTINPQNKSQLFTISKKDSDVLWFNSSGDINMSGDISMGGSISMDGNVEIYNSGQLLMTLHEMGQSFYDDGVLIGKVGTNFWDSDPDYKGLVFDLEEDTGWMSWSVFDSNEDLYLTKLAYHNKEIDDFKEGLHFLCPTYSHGNLYLDDNSSLCLFGGGQVGCLLYSDFVFVDSSLNPLFWIQEDSSEIGIYTDINMNGNDINNQSDYRLKTNIVDVSENALSLLNRINLKSFDWIKSGKHENMGIIAQQLETILPDLISTNETTEIKSIKIVKLIPYIIKAIQELSEKINYADESFGLNEIWVDDMSEDEKNIFIQNSISHSNPLAVKTNETVKTYRTITASEGDDTK